MILFAYGHQSLQVIYYVILWIVLSRMAVQRDSFPGCPTQSFFLSLWFSQRVHRQPKALDEPTSGLSLALIGNASGGEFSGTRRIAFEAFSIRRLGGSRWRLRRTR